MASASLLSLRRGLLEIDELQRADPTPVGDAPKNPEISRVVGRASVVLLSSHFERYIYALNEEATEVLNREEVQGHVLPELLRLIHSQSAIDDLFATQWDRRGPGLTAFVEDEAWLWARNRPGFLEHKNLLEWMKAPSPQNLTRYFRCWGIEDIFSVVTRAPHTRSDLWLRIEELVSKRNNIAHGDLSVEATSIELGQYRDASATFAERADRLLAKHVGKYIDRKTAW